MATGCPHPPGNETVKPPPTKPSGGRERDQTMYEWMAYMWPEGRYVP